MHEYTTVRRALILGVLLMTTSATGAFAAGTDIVLHARRATVLKGAWTAVSDATAAGGVRLANPEAGLAKVSTAAASPASYFELAFTPEAGRAYHLWIRSKAQNDSWQNDSVYVQFSGSLTSAGAATYRIGTTSAAMYSLEEDSGRGLAGWGWQDNGYGLNVLGAPIYFDGQPQTIRVQSREDGISIDQIVLSPVTYATVAPGSGKNDTKILAETSTTTTTTTTTTSTTTTPTTTTTTTSGTFTWTGMVNASASGAVLKKVAGCSTCADAGGLGQGTATSVSFTVSSGTSLTAGLGRDTSTNTSAAIDYSFRFYGSGYWEIRESGTYRTEGPYSASDVFKVAVEGTAVKYYRNGAAVYTSTVPVSTALVVDASLSSSSATVSVVASTGTATTTTTTTPTTTTTTTSTSNILRVLQWNTHHGGYGTDNAYDTNRLATWAAKMNPDVILFNEIEKFTYWGNQDQPEVYKNLLQQKTGKTWYYTFAQEFGQWGSNGKGNLILSTVPFQYTNQYELVFNGDRSIGEAVIEWNNVPITLLVTHLDPYDQALRLTQAKEVTTWAGPEPENKILTGDMNAWPDQTSIAHLNTLYYDSWAVAAANGTATAFSGNSGETKNGRIDYIFYSKGSRNLAVKSSQVVDTRDANGVMPSDHRPVLTTFIVQ